MSPLPLLSHCAFDCLPMPRTLFCSKFWLESVEFECLCSAQNFHSRLINGTPLLSRKQLLKVQIVSVWRHCVRNGTRQFDSNGSQMNIFSLRVNEQMQINLFSLKLIGLQAECWVTFSKLLDAGRLFGGGRWRGRVGGSGLADFVGSRSEAVLRR